MFADPWRARSLKLIRTANPFAPEPRKVLLHVGRVTRRESERIVLRAAAIKVRRARERHRLHSGGQNLWLTFFPELATEPLAHGFGALVALNEGMLPPEGTMLTYCRRGSEIITYVIDGSLSHKDGSGSRSHLLSSGDFQRSSANHSDHISYTNASGRDELHVVQLSLLAEAARLRPSERRSFPVTDRVGGLRLVGSADGRLGSLQLDQDARVYSGVFASGHELDYRLNEGRMAWLQVVRGDVELGDTALTIGDGAGVSSAGDLRLRARSAAEVVLLDLAGPQPRCSTHADGHPAARFDGFAGGAAAHG
jgi:redox-sensitive bicupin YhaK (pirin superfamily)